MYLKQEQSLHQFVKTFSSRHKSATLNY